MKPFNCSLLFLIVSTFASCQNDVSYPGILQYPSGYPNYPYSALQQLENYPLPRYLPGNHLLRLFNWMDPNYMGGMGQPGIQKNDFRRTACELQKELSHNWNYGIVIPGSRGIFNAANPSDTTIPPVIRLANDNPGISLDIITLWVQMNPTVLNYSNKRPMILNKDLDPSLYLTFNYYGNTQTEITFNFPDSLIARDGSVQKFYLSWILKRLKRPVNRINENGEEPPGIHQLPHLADNPKLVSMKESMGIESWADFAATRKLQMRDIYSSSFMKTLPELKQTLFSFYAVDAGPIDRFEWSIIKKCMTPINGIYYSTPDYYPCWTRNWKEGAGPWHGWNWIETGRKTEIKDGNNLFSPFVAAGWSGKYENNITPGQWLGLLKCLSVVGAEFYYVGYFNEKVPFTNPALYAWQAAMPAYAQAITSRFEDVLRNGNVLFNNEGEPIISYPADDKHVLVTARKHNSKQKYVICGTYQPFSNDSDEIPEKKNVSVIIDGTPLSFEVRRQGSVYIYEKTNDNREIFYQLDSWHENAHPDHWSKDFYFEAEVADSGLDEKDIYTNATGNKGDYTRFVSYIHPEINKEYCYNYTVRDSVKHTYSLWVRYKSSGTLSFSLINSKGAAKMPLVDFPQSNEWKWIKVEFPTPWNSKGNNMLKIAETNGAIDLDKFVITTKEGLHPSQ